MFLAGLNLVIEDFAILPTLFIKIINLCFNITLLENVNVVIFVFAKDAQYTSG